MRNALLWIGTLGLTLAASACALHEVDPMPMVTPNYGYTPAQTDMGGEPSPYEVSSMPPEPLYEQMSPSPGDGDVWIDGSWHWNGYEWVWVGGRWERGQDGYAYCAPSYTYDNGAYIYTPGYWRSARALPAGWQVRGGGGGRPPIVRPPPQYHPPIVGSRPGPIGRPPSAQQGPRPLYPPTYHPPVGGNPVGYRPSEPDRPIDGDGPRYPGNGAHEPIGRDPEQNAQGNAQRGGVIRTEHPIYTAPAPEPREGPREDPREGPRGQAYQPRPVYQQPVYQQPEPARGGGAEPPRASEPPPRASEPPHAAPSGHAAPAAQSHHH